ncbi:exodeoxyribonuclease V subunit gamma [Sandaracinus amylolyticus]|uniref:Exodeoxyribonuclease V gamma chain n=1 Tax=Sandaracinus amylolyticus TaxID=927083 RepID=A0A0F6W9U7_9BACT|nr:exodeoxyribonuclease V subunit gamma [Sandaracinus amylolyticus]AKF11125.1 Exodeoxyribonuclease V gamma chain [Sandaracinus amylolyticus]
MIRLVYSNRTEHLVRALAARIAERADPLDAVTIVVPNRPMERWVEMQLASRLGIAANLRFVRLERFVSERLAREGAPKVLEGAAIEGRLLATLLELGAGDPELEPVRSYLRAAGDDGDAISRRAVQLARRLARSFEEYGFSRAKMIEAWSKGALELEGTSFAATERWQRALFLAVRGRGDAQLEAMTLADALSAAAPESAASEAHVFGVSYVARIFQQAIAALGAKTALHVYALNPCEEFWEDAISDAEARRAKRRARARGEHDPYALESDVDNALLRAWGRPGREHVAMLDELTGFDAHASFDDPGDATLLSRIQSAILRRAPIEAGETIADGSVQLLACPSIRRELETVATEIWSLIDGSQASERPYRFHEIAVLVNGPDRDRYLPHLEAVFAEAHDLPWNAADLALAARSRVADCALRLIDLPASSFTRAALLEILAHPLVLARWSDADPARVAALCDRLGVFHGIDARDHRGTYLEGSGLVHWDQAVRRLALGVVMEGGGSFDIDAVPLAPEPIAGSDELGGGLGLLVRSLASDARFARGAAMLPSEWARFFEALLRSYLVVGEGPEESELRRCLTALAELAKRDAGVRVGYSVAAELARAELESLPAARGVPLGDGVVVASLLPMRAIPFRAIFVLGLGEGRFPARELETGLDLRAAGRKPGDVSIDERDRYTFLETLLCARDRLVLSWIARDEQSGEARQPSSVVSAIEEAIGAPVPRRTPTLRRHDELADDAIRAHALPAAADEARARIEGAPHRRALADARFPEAALALLPESDPRRALLAMPRVPPRARDSEDEPRERVSIEAIRRFLECPIQGHARLVIGQDQDDVDAAAEDEPFEVARTERDRVLEEVFLAALERDDAEIDAIYRTRIAQSAARGAWPIGVLATLRREEDRRDLLAWRRGYARFPAGTRIHRVRFGATVARGEVVIERPHEPVLVPLGSDHVEVIGATRWLLSTGDSLRTTTSTRLEGQGERARVEQLRYALRAFVDHAVLAASGISSGNTRRAWVLDRCDGGPLVVQLAPMRKEAAARWLAGVLDDLREGPHGVFLPCEAVLRSEALFTRGHDHPSEELARSIEQVRTKWDGGSSKYGPVRDAALHPAPEPKSALALASRRFRAFFDHLRGIKRAP